MSNQMMGVDVGGSGIKGGIVDLVTGELVGERHKLKTPKPSKPKAVTQIIAEVIAMAEWDGPIGCTLPGPVQGGLMQTAANVDDGWIGRGAEYLSQRLKRPVTLMNDADAAGVAEMAWGIGRDHPARSGVVILLTFGTGIGSAVFTNGELVSNTELGHLQMWDDSAEVRASSNAKDSEKLSWEEWAERVSAYLQYVEALFWPQLFIFGGGVSRKHEKFLHLLETRTPIVPAALRNNAGIAGVALAASRGEQP